MDVLISFLIFFVSLIFSISMGVSILIPLIIGLCCFTFIGLHKGLSLKMLFPMMKSGAVKSLVVIQILMFIGLITALWRACGTIPFIVYYGIKIITPSLFVLMTFLITSILSFVLGTSFGVVGTAGVAFMILARSGGENLHLVAGAILSGAYFGDRCAFTSSSANLVAAVTQTDLYQNVKTMLKTAFVPFIITTAIYFFLSKSNALYTINTSLLPEISEKFHLNLWCVLPIVLMIVLPILKSGVKTAMLLSILSAAILCLTLQKMSMPDVLITAVSGFHMDDGGQFARIIAGGGVVSMVKVSLIVLISSTYSGIFDGTGILDGVQTCLINLSKKITLFPVTILTAIVTVICSCNQTLAIMLTDQMMGKAYEDQNKTKSEFASDMENSVVLIAALIPWSIAVAVPLDVLSVSAKSILYAFFLYLVPLYNLFAKHPAARSSAKVMSLL